MILPDGVLGSASANWVYRALRSVRLSYRTVATISAFKASFAPASGPNNVRYGGIKLVHFVLGADFPEGSNVAIVCVFGAAAGAKNGFNCEVLNRFIFSPGSWPG